jgi:hypothetical protein
MVPEPAGDATAGTFWFLVGGSRSS